MGQEIERKYLVAAPPDLSAPPIAGATAVDIEQTYLHTADERPGSRRVRSWREGGRTRYLRTVKSPAVDGVRAEDEDEITPEEYAGLLAEADPERVPIRKTRYRFRHGGRLWELDHIVAPVELWLLEVEFPSVEAFRAPIELPPGLGDARDVTDDPAYTNAALACSRRLPGQEE